MLGMTIIQSAIVIRMENDNDGDGLAIKIIPRVITHRIIRNGRVILCGLGILTCSKAGLNDARNVFSCLKPTIDMPRTRGT